MQTPTHLSPTTPTVKLQTAASTACHKPGQPGNNWPESLDSLETTGLNNRRSTASSTVAAWLALLPLCIKTVPRMCCQTSPLAPAHWSYLHIDVYLAARQQLQAHRLLQCVAYDLGQLCGAPVHLAALAARTCRVVSRAHFCKGGVSGWGCRRARQPLKAEDLGYPEARCFGSCTSTTLAF